VNLTDGLDGLAAGLVAIAALTFAGMCYVSGHARISQYLHITFLPYSGELAVFCAAVLGAALGFLWYNCHPADVFMGDTGSLALGGALAWWPCSSSASSGSCSWEACSCRGALGDDPGDLVRMWGRRVFRMAPLHHHFELLGWPESRVVLRFYIVGVLLALLSFSTFKLQ